MKTKIYLLLFFLFTLNGFSQETKMSIKNLINFSDLPIKTNETPSWANQFYENPDKINVNILKEEINEWISKEKKEKVSKETDKKSENELQESISENPIVRFALYFVNSIPGTWLDKKGNFNLPTKTELIKNTENLEKAKTNQSKNVLANNWSQIGSKEVTLNGVQIVGNTNIYHISVAPSSTDIRLASTETQLLYKTVDAGENWTLLLEEGGPSAFHPTDANNIILASNPFRRSSDGGTTWTVIPVAEGCNEIIWSNDGNTVLAATNNGIYVSSDGGLSFSQKLTNTFMDVEFKPGSSTIAYAVNMFGVFYKSIDAGLTWVEKPISYAITDNQHGFLIGVSNANPDLVAVACLSGYEFNGPSNKCEIIKSINSGENFAQLSISPVGFSQGWYDFVFGISPVNENTYFFGACSFHKSTDGGLTFNAIGGYAPPFGTHPDIQDMVLFGDNVVLSTDGGVSASTDSFTSLSNWKSTSKGLDALLYWGFDVGFNTDQMGGGKFHNGNSIYNPEWDNGKALFLGGGEEPDGKAIFSRPNSMFFSGVGKNFKQIDITYNPISTVGPQFALENNILGYGDRISDTSSNTDFSNIIYAGTGNNVVISYDNGVTKQILKSFNSLVWDIKTTRKDSKVLYVMTQTDGLFKTIDGGVTWTATNGTVNGVNLTSLGRNCYIDVSQTNSNEIWLLFRNDTSDAKICKSLDGGLTWISLNSPILNDFWGVQIANQYGSDGGVYIVGTVNNAAKCFYRNNTMPDWIDYSSNLRTRTVGGSTNVYFRASYYKEKLRVAGPVGVQEISFYEKSNPVAQPTTNIKDVCVNQEIKFSDYSILDYTGATWEWSFSKTPVYLNGTSAGSRDPIVKFLSPGVVNATLKVTNSSGISDTKTVTNFITVSYDATSCLVLNSDFDNPVNCVNIIPSVPNIAVGSQGLVTNFNGATTGKFIVKLNLFTNCGNFTANMTAIVNLDTNQISVIRYSHFEDGVLPIQVTGNNTNNVTSYSNRWAQVSFSLI
uniref:PKD domain-containing protein n=1 Tax=Flavobacterium sp. TaxID=239 RepID=UPI00286CFBD9